MFKALQRKKSLAKKKRKVPQERSIPRMQIYIGIGITLGIALLLTAIYYGSRIESLQITEIQVHGGYTIPHDVVRSEVAAMLVGSHFRLIPYTFSWTYPKRAIIKRLEEIPRLKQSSLSLEGQVLAVVFDEYQPAALWCTVATSDCYFVDQSGFAFSRAPELTGGAFIRYGETGKEVEVKTQALDREFLKTSKAFAEKLADELGLYVTHVTVLDALDVTYTVSGGGVVKVSRRMDLDTTFKNLRTILLSESFTHLEAGAFQYIDLRFGDKVFVNEVTTKEKTATSSEEAVE